MFYLMTHSLLLFMVIWHQPYGKRPLRKPTGATTWATLSYSSKESFICTIPQTE